MSSDLAVVICTHNPRGRYFERCLAALRTQTLSTARWDLLVIDNRSSPSLDGRIDLSFHPSARLIREEALGLTKARLRGIRETTAPLIVFVDDDNVLDDDFLQVVVDTAVNKPFLGSFSGQCRPGFETAPPAWTQRYWGNLAVREFDEDVWSNLPRLPDSMPCGAGLCIRRAVAEHYVELHDTHRRNIHLDRVGTSLMSGGDNDLAACACDVGLGVGLIAALRLTHLVSPDRLTEDYLARLAEGIYFSSVLLAHFRSSPRELASYEVRWTEHARALLAKRPHRTILRAGLRGRTRGLAQISSQVSRRA